MARRPRFPVRTVWGPAGKVVCQALPFPPRARRSGTRTGAGGDLQPVSREEARPPRSLPFPPPHPTPQSATLKGTGSGPPGLRPGAGSSGASLQRAPRVTGRPPGRHLPRPRAPLSASPEGQLKHRSRDNLQPATGTVPVPPPREPPRPSDPPPHLRCCPGATGPPPRHQRRPADSPGGWAGQGRAGRREAAARRALDVGRAPGAGGGGGGDGSGCCRYSCRLVQLLLRRRLLPSRWASGVARRGRTEAPLPLGVSQVSSSLRRRQGRGPRPAPARQPPAPPKPYLSAPGEDRGPRSGRGRSPWPRAAAARLLCPRER